MTTQQWSAPVQTAQPPTPCWGNPRSFDPNSRECRGCTVQGSCKEKVDQQRGLGQYVPPAAAYQPPTYQPPAAAYQQPAYPQATWQTQQAHFSTSPWVNRQASAQPWQPQVQVMPPQQPPQIVYVMQNGEHYGRYTDPVHYAIASAPLPPRNQMQGETFLGRFMKNVFLGALESVAEESLKGVRQMVLPPPPPNRVIDIK